MKIAKRPSPRRGRRIKAQDERSAVLGKADKMDQSPVGASEMLAQILKGIDNVSTVPKAPKYRGRGL
jgi:hypothetical protein